MTTANELTPAYTFHPGDDLKDELEARGITQTDFAKEIGLKKSQLNEIIKGKRDINADIALLFEKALGISADYWMTAQKNYELNAARIKARQKERLEAIELWEMIKDKVASKFFKKEGVISGDPVEDLPILKTIYSIEAFDELAKINAQPAFARFRKSESLKVDKQNLIAWVKLVQFLAAKERVGPFNYNNKEKLIHELKLLFRENYNLKERVKETLANNGIKLVYQRKGEKTPVDGVSFWSHGNPAIGMTLRHNRLDNFAFTLFHELGHIYLHLPNNNEAEFIDLDVRAEDKEFTKQVEEIEANKFAQDFLIDKGSWASFFDGFYDYADEDILNFAEKANIHPAIVKGRICFEKNFYGIKSEIDHSIN